jgi:hypothetical protein
MHIDKQFTWGDEWLFSCKILYLHKFFLSITTPKSNPSKHYKHFRKAIAFAFWKLELCRHCRFRAGSFSGLSSRIQVLVHMPPPPPCLCSNFSVFGNLKSPVSLLIETYRKCFQLLTFSATKESLVN